MAGLAVKLPLEKCDVDGYKSIKNYKDMVKQNLKMLLLTNPGERIMMPMYGIGLKKFLFSQDHPSVHAEIEGAIRKHVSKYLPFLQIGSVDIESSDSVGGTSAHVLKISIHYKIVPLKSFDRIEVTVS